jgi:Xaa-Pro aminopeptidase
MARAGTARTTAAKSAKGELKLNDRQMAIVEAEYPRFSDGEMRRRRDAMARAMQEAEVDHLLVYGSGFRGGAVGWLSQWLATTEAQLIFTPGEKDAMFVQFYNHLPLARTLASEADVGWGGASTIQTSIAELVKRGARQGRVGIAGGMPFGPYRALAAKFGDVVDMNRAYNRLRLIKSPEETEWCRIGARMSDLSIEALCREIRPGLTERDLGAIVESAFIKWGAQHVIHFFSVNPMRAPVYGVPRQYPSTRKVENGDVISTEITCTFWDYGGQVLRTFSVGEELVSPYRELHKAADLAFDAILKAIKPGTHAADLVRAAQPIEDAGFTTYDDLVHGTGGGYLPPIVGSPSRQNEPIPDMRLEPGMQMVIQPNVITRDEKAGIQTGEAVVVTERGAESLHTAARGPFVVGA